MNLLKIILEDPCTVRVERLLRGIFVDVVEVHFACTLVVVVVGEGEDDRVYYQVYHT